jgi:flagellar hook-basal body complex protein FliE
MNTIKVKAVNSGHRGLVLKTTDGTVEVEAGQTKDVEILPLDDERKAFYAERGLTISEAKPRKAKKPDNPDLDTLEKAVETAKAAFEAAETAANAADAGDVEKETLAAAQIALTEAEKALEAALA